MTPKAALEAFLWLVHESDGALGLKAQSYDPKPTMDAQARAIDIAEHEVMSRIAHVERERTIRHAVNALRLSHPDMLSVLYAYAGKRKVAQWMRDVWGDLAGVASMTEAYQSACQAKKLTRIRDNPKKQAIIRIAVKVQAQALLDRAAKALSERVKT